MAMITMIKKRDGRQVPFNIEKIAGAIFKAAQVVGGNDYEEAMQYAATTVKQAEMNGYPVKVDIEIKYVEEGQD